MGKAVVEPALADPLRAGSRQLTAFVTEHILAAQRDGAAVAGLDPHREAVTLLAVADGLMLHLLIGQVDDGDALDAVDACLDRVFLSPGRRGA